MTTFDPWTASLEQASAQPNAYEPQGAIAQWDGVQQLTANREQIVKGSGFGVLWAVALCATRGLVMPDWLASIFLQRYRAVQRLNVDSWDHESAFGRPYPKGKQLAALRRSRNSLIGVVNAVSDAISRDPERVIDTAFWEEIGQRAGEGKTRAQELHAQAVRSGWAVSPSARKSKLLARPSNPTKPRKLTGLLRRR